MGKDLKNHLVPTPLQWGENETLLEEDTGNILARHGRRKEKAEKR